MKALALARRYARALSELAGAQQDKVLRDLEELAAAWTSSKELREVFENPAVPQAARVKVIETLAARMGLAPDVRSLLKLLSDRRRLRHIPDIAEAFRTLAEDRSGRVRAEVVTAVPMPDSYYLELGRALEQVTGKKVVLIKRQDPTLLGGVVTRVGDKVFDGSLRTRLDELKDTLLHR